MSGTPAWLRPADPQPFRECGCGGRVRVAGVEVVRPPKVWFRCDGCGTRWVELAEPDDEEDASDG